MPPALHRCLLACLPLAASLGFVAPAQAAPPKVHPASQQEFVGTWKSIPLPLAEQPEESRSRPLLQSPCNYLVHGADGNWSLVTIENVPGNEEKAKRCNLTLKEIAAQSALLPDNMRFRWTLKDGRARMVNDAGVGFIWSAQIAEADGSIALDPQSAGVALKRGDLVMQLQDRSGARVLWHMVLRKVTR